MGLGSTLGGNTPTGVPPSSSGRYSYGSSRYQFQNRVDVYLRVPVKDKDRATVPTYTLVISQLECSVQQHPVTTRYDENQAIIAYIPTKVYFRTNPGVQQYSKLVWMDDLGQLHNVIVERCRNLAGRGANFVADCEERL